MRTLKSIQEDMKKNKECREKLQLELDEFNKVSSEYKIAMLLQLIFNDIHLNDLTIEEKQQHLETARCIERQTYFSNEGIIHLLEIIVKNKY